VIPDPEDERPPKKQRKPVTATKIWVGNSCSIFELFSDCDFKALKDELSDYTFLRSVAEMSGYEPQSFDTIECQLADTVSRQQLTFQYDGCRSAKRWMSIINHYFRQTVHTYAKLCHRRWMAAHPCQGSGGVCLEVVIGHTRRRRPSWVSRPQQLLM